MSSRSVVIRTNGDGEFTYERPMKGQIQAIEYINTDLSTPDIDVSDGTYSTSVLSVNGVAADTVWVPSTSLQTAAGAAADVSDETGVVVGSLTSAVIMGTLKVEITGGGASKRGRLNFIYQN